MGFGASNPFRLPHRFHPNFQTGFAFVLIRSNAKSNVPRLRRQRIERGAEENCAALIFLLPQNQCQMVFADNSRRDCRFDPAREKNRLRIAIAKRLEHFVPAEKIERVHSPMGLDIGALTPEEIAVSVVAEMIAVRRGLAPSPISLSAKSNVPQEQ